MLQTVAKITQALRRHPFSHTGNYHIINYRKDHTSIAKPPISPCRKLLNLPCRKDHTSIATPTISPYRQPSKFPWPQSSHKHCDTTMSINHQNYICPKDHTINIYSSISCQTIHQTQTAEKFEIGKYLTNPQERCPKRSTLARVPRHTE